MGKFLVAEDLVGKTFGRLKVLVRVSNCADGHSLWKCRCTCGNIKMARGSRLNLGRVSSCGCLTIEALKKANTIHGLRNSKTYKAWLRMMSRCYNPLDSSYKNYGGRGITVCPKWKNSMLKFYRYMGERPSGMSLDRIDNDGNYEPKNVRWATRKQQNNNTRRTRFIKFNGKRMSMKMWGAEVGINCKCIQYRLNHGWTVKEALTTPSFRKAIKA